MWAYLINNLTFALNLGAILGGTLFVGFLINKFFRRLIERSHAGQDNDPTSYQFLRRALLSIVYIIGFSLVIYSIPSLRTLASSLLAGAGILAVAIGFASQHALSNIISGVFIIIFKPFRVKDRVKVGVLSGIVEDITLRHVVLKDFENRSIIIPNSIISNEVIVNSDFGEKQICKWFDVGISYESDLALAKSIIREEIMGHPLWVDVRSPEQITAGQDPVTVRVVALGDFSVNIRAWAWAKDNGDAFVLGCDLLESVKARFEAASIDIPYPHRTIVQK